MELRESKNPSLMPTLSDQELSRYSGEHLLYELQMFAILAGVLAGGHASEDWLRNALLESFALHLRNLLVFFYPGPGPAHALAAREFFAEAAAELPPLPPLSAESRARVTHQLAPLTVHRSAAAPQAWNVAQIEAEMRGVAAAFVELASPARLHTNVVAFVSNWEPGVREH